MGAWLLRSKGHTKEALGLRWQMSRWPICFEASTEIEREDKVVREVDINFQDRKEAGQVLAYRLSKYADQKPIVLGLPRGGVPVAFEVAIALDAPLDVFVVRNVPHDRLKILHIECVSHSNLPAYPLPLN